MTGRRHLVVVPQPLPECQLCARPTKRDTWDRLGGLCSECDDGIAAISVPRHAGGPIGPWKED